jgi:hypothetical protein
MFKNNENQYIIKFKPKNENNEEDFEIYLQKRNGYWGYEYFCFNNGLIRVECLNKTEDIEVDNWSIQVPNYVFELIKKYKKNN